MKRITIAAAALLGALAVSQPVEADVGIDASLGFAHSLMRSDSINSVADHDSLAGSMMSAGYRLGTFNGIALTVLGQLELGSLSGDTFQQIDTDLWVTRLAVGLRGSYPVYDRISAFGRVTTGVEWGHLSLSNPISAADPIDDWSRGGTAALFGGAELTFDELSSSNVVGFGVRLEAGYTRSTSLGFSAQPSVVDEDTIEISTVAAQLGELNTSGWGYRVSVVMKF